MSFSFTHFNGKVASAADLAPLAFSGYAHFTAMQVHGHAVRGLDLHLDRLKRASDELFGWHLPDVKVRELLRQAIRAAPADSSVGCYISARPGEFAAAGVNDALDVLIRVTDPALPPRGPLALELVRHQRHLPHIKHVGEVSKTLYLRRAVTHGFDDAAFEDEAGRLSEATIWNLAFWDGDTVIWPDAELLAGVTMQILARQLRAEGISQETREIRQPDLTQDMSGVVMNSWTPGIGLSRIGSRKLNGKAGLVELLHRAYSAEPPVLV